MPEGSRESEEPEPLTLRLGKNGRQSGRSRVGGRVRDTCALGLEIAMQVSTVRVVFEKFQRCRKAL